MVRPWALRAAAAPFTPGGWPSTTSTWAFVDRPRGGWGAERRPLGRTKLAGALAVLLCGLPAGSGCTHYPEYEDSRGARRADRRTGNSWECGAAAAAATGRA